MQIFCVQADTKVFRYITTDGRKLLKHILTYLHSIKYNEINICHLDVQNHISHAESSKKFVIHYGLYLETAGNVFSFIFHS